MTEIQKDNKNVGKVPNRGKSNIPRLRFSEFDKGWEKETIGNILTIGSGCDYKHLSIGNIPVFGTGGHMASVNDYLFDGETVCIGRKGTINKPFYFYGKFWTVDTLFYTHSFKRTLPKFVYYVFEQINWLKYNEASGVPSLSKSTIEKIDINIPNSGEQQKISDFLSLIDKRIQTQNKILLHYQSLIENIADQYADQKIKLNTTFPDWKKITLAKLGKTFNGLSGKTKEDFGNGKRYIQYKQIFDSSKIMVKNCGLVNILENENQNGVQYGDIFFTISSETPDEIGMSSVLLEDVKDVYLNSFCFGFRLDSFDKLLPKFARFLFRTKVVRNELKKLAQGSTRYNISKTELLKLEISLPSIEEQKKISLFLSSLDQKIQIEKAILEQLEMQKKYLLRQMFI